MTEEAQESQDAVGEPTDKVPAENFVLSKSDIPVVARRKKTEDSPAKDPSDGAEKDRGDEAKKAAKANEAAEAKAREKKAWDEMPEGVRKRILRANRQRDRALEKVEVAEGERDDIRERLDTVEKKVGDATPEPKLDPDDFDTYDGYLAAEKKARKKEAPPKARAKEISPEDFRATHGVAPDDLASARDTLEETVFTADPDLWEAVSEMKGLKISPTLVMALAETNNPTEVLRQLTADPKKAEAFSKLSPFAQARELAALDRPVEKQRAVSKAPPPPEPGGTRGAGRERPLDELSQREFEARRNDDEAASRNRGDFWL